MALTHINFIRGLLMKKDQAEVLNIVQQVLRHVLISVAATDPTKTEVLSTTLAAAATNTAIDPQARLMLLDLCDGVTMLSSAGKTRQ